MTNKKDIAIKCKFLLGQWKENLNLKATDFLKEINDTGLFLKRTIDNYINKKNYSYLL